MNENQPKQKDVVLKINTVNGGVAGNVEGNQIINSKQSLPDSAAEIQELLQFLDRSYPSNLSEKKRDKIDVAVTEINKNPGLKERFISALKSGSTEALKEFLNNPYINTFLAAYEGWQSQKKSHND